MNGRQAGRSGRPEWRPECSWSVHPRNGDGYSGISSSLVTDDYLRSDRRCGHTEEVITDAPRPGRVSASRRAASSSLRRSASRSSCLLEFFLGIPEGLVGLLLQVRSPLLHPFQDVGQLALAVLDGSARPDLRPCSRRVVPAARVGIRTFRGLCAARPISCSCSPCS